jgi:Spy/CpxP family protein refolding chaperone
MIKHLRIPLLASISFAAFLIGHAQTSSATGEGTTGGHSFLHVMQFANALGLTPAQQAQFRAIRTQEEIALRAIRSDTDPDSAQRRNEAEATYQHYDAQREALLTPEQRATLWRYFEHAQTEQVTKTQIKYSLSWLAHELGLSPGQIDAFRTQREQEEVALRAIHDNPALTYQEKYGEVEAIRIQSIAQREQLLTPEQLAKFQRMHAAGKI